MKGAPCRWDREECPIASHKRFRDNAALKPQRESSERRANPDLPLEGLARRDIAETGWSVARALAEGSLDPREASVFASLLRVLLAAGSGGVANDDALREVELRGILMHGIPPRDAGEWELMESTFSPEAVAEARRWQRLFEDDALDGVEPGVFLQRLSRQEGEPTVVDPDDEVGA